MIGENTAPLTAEEEQRVTAAIFGAVKNPMWQSIGQRNRNVLRGRNAISGMEGSRSGGVGGRIPPSARERLIAALLMPKEHHMKSPQQPSVGGTADGPEAPTAIPPSPSSSST